ncbi:MAG: NPCBM/NEW2 domain-containing protein [Planctomycetota bacterium]
MSNQRLIAFRSFYLLTCCLVWAEIQIETITTKIQGDRLEIQEGKAKIISISGEIQLVSLADIVSISLTQSLPQKHSGLTCFQFRNGDCIYGDILYEAKKEQNDVLFIASASLSKDPFKIYLTDLNSITFEENVPPLETLEQEDQIILKNGDRSRGKIEYVDNTGFQFNSSLGSTTRPFANLTAVVFAKKKPAPFPSGILGIIQTVDNTLLTVRLKTIENSLIQATTFWSIPTLLNIPLEQVQFIHFKNGHFKYLSDLEPIDIQYVSFFDMPFPYKRDLNQRGGPLMMAGRSYFKGLGVHSKTTLFYETRSEYSEFRVVIGLDDCLQNTKQTYGGRVRFMVLVDGKIMEDHLLEMTMPPKELSVSIKEAEELQLVVDFGDPTLPEDPINDIANWCNAILIE